jgi:DNA-binding CsgD family transcriptional regulator
MRVPAAGPEPDGWLPKGADGPTLAAALRHARRRPLHVVSGPGSTARGGRNLSLSARERQMLVLISAGLSNEEIAARCYLSINSVKTFIRAAYRKIGVERRVEAAMWVAEHLDTGSDVAVEMPEPAAAV